LVFDLDRLLPALIIFLVLYYDLALSSLLYLLVLTFACLTSLLNKFKLHMDPLESCAS